MKNKMKEIGITLALGLLVLMVYVGFLHPNSTATAEYEFSAGSVPTPTVVPEPTAIPFFEGEVSVVYNYDALPDWLDTTNLPAGVDLLISRDESRDYPWSVIEITPQHPTISLFDMRVGKVEFTTDGGCYWDRVGKTVVEGGAIPGGITSSTYKPLYGCLALEAVVFKVDVLFAYCLPYTDGHAVLCAREGLELVVDFVDNTISFTVEGSFSPQYRIWIQEVLDYFESDTNLPEILRPGYNYTFGL